MLMTRVEGAYGRNGDSANANWAEGGEKTRDRGDVTERCQGNGNTGDNNRMLLC